MSPFKTRAEAQQELSRLVSDAAAEEAYAATCPVGSKQRARALLRATTRTKSAADLRAIINTLPA